MTNKSTGKYGEELAKEFLIKKGFEILETNFRYSKMAEIDIIAKKKNAIHFVEVKTRHGLDCGNPLEAITQSKLRSIQKCAMFYMSKNKLNYSSIQIDAIGIVLKDDGSFEINFIENISL